MKRVFTRGTSLPRRRGEQPLPASATFAALLPAINHKGTPSYHARLWTQRHRRRDRARGDLMTVGVPVAVERQLHSRLTAERGQVTGLLRINAPRGVLDTLLIPILTRLARQHPPLTVEVRTGAFPGDIVSQGFDAGIIIRRFIQQDMVTTRLTGAIKLILVASRDYLDARGTPKSIADLHQHNCIGIRNIVSGAVFDWELIDGKRLITVKTSGTALVTNSTQALSLALAGVGIAYVVEPVARRYLREGSLTWLLQWNESGAPLSYSTSAV